MPDLPPEEAADLQTLAVSNGLAYVYFLAPTSSAERIKQVAAAAQGFIYLVSVTGVTGARSELKSDLAGFVQRVRSQSTLPLAIGFGISSPAQAASVAGLADGVIVGSALINATNEAEDKPAAAARFVRSLQSALTI